jgi:hypothetical protein
VLLAAGLTVLFALSGKADHAIGALLTSGALAAWLAVVFAHTFGRRVALVTPPKPAKRQRARKSKARVVAATDSDDPRIQPGDYFLSGRSLYRVEHLAGARVLVEDCRSGELFDIDREACAALRRVRRSIRRSE